MTADPMGGSEIGRDRIGLGLSFEPKGIPLSENLLRDRGHPYMDFLADGGEDFCRELGAFDDEGRRLEPTARLPAGNCFSSKGAYLTTRMSIEWSTSTPRSSIIDRERRRCEHHRAVGPYQGRPTDGQAGREEV